MESNYQPNSVPYAVGIADNLTLTTASKRQMPLKIYYPESQGVFPVIIFSHGAGASKDSAEALGRFWASHGYISIHPTHADSLALRNDDAGLWEVVSTMLKDSNGWVERAKDISLIIDSLDNLAKQAPQLQGKMDRKRIGVGGHSYGAYTAQLIGGATIDIPGGAKHQSFASPQVKAILLLSPQGRGQQGLTDSSWNQMNKPMMVMTGSKDQGAQGKGTDWKREPFDFAPPGNKYLVFIKNADHFSFTGRQAGEGGLGLRDSRLRRGRFRDRLNNSSDTVNNREPIFDYVKIASLAFWDAYLKDENSARIYLESDNLAKYSKGNVTLSTK
jgi:dienelactone hydrolase